MGRRREKKHISRRWRQGKLLVLWRENFAAFHVHFHLVVVDVAWFRCCIIKGFHHDDNFHNFIIIFFFFSFLPFSRENIDLIRQRGLNLKIFRAGRHVWVTQKWLKIWKLFFLSLQIKFYIIQRVNSSKQENILVLIKIHERTSWRT